MAWLSDNSYAYDGSFDGLLTGVFESYERKEKLVDFRPAADPQYVLFGSRLVETDPDKANRVYSAVGTKISPAAQELIRLGFLTCAPDKELLIYRFLRLGFEYGGAVMNMLTENTVHRLNKAVKHLKTESHALTGFVRFSVYGDTLAAVIEPKNWVLPVLAPHFCNRYAHEYFMIYDQTHKQALLHRPDLGPRERVAILETDELNLPDANEEELAYRRLWRQYYNTAAIKERANPRAQASHMPKRYWAHLTEMSN